MTEDEWEQRVDSLDYERLGLLRDLAGAECKIEFYEGVLSSINKLVTMLGEANQ
jgi:hypothetical protein